MLTMKSDQNMLCVKSSLFNRFTNAREILMNSINSKHLHIIINKIDRQNTKKILIKLILTRF